MINKQVGSRTFGFFQTGGYDDTIAAAKAKFERDYGVVVTDIEFDAAYPGDRNGRWVDFKVQFTVSPKAS